MSCASAKNSPLSEMRHISRRRRREDDAKFAAPDRNLRNAVCMSGMSSTLAHTAYIFMRDRACDLCVFLLMPRVEHICTYYVYIPCA